FSIGKNVSLGCVRLQNEDVKVLYEKVNVGDEVLIYSSEIDEDLSKSISLLLNFYDLKKFIIRESH
ncbi:MAG TPA: L,D-transpeptidase family protein, partial [Caldisericia bacterium]|nr:L,D-transpeptidase family protein [Caldisericia bacterium]